jgi:2-isopropylmalate synthase
MDKSELIYDWNKAEHEALPLPASIEFDDETLRDGLQSPSVKNPTLEEKIKILHLMDRLGIHTADVGLPGAGPQHIEHIRALCREMRDSHLKIRPNVACRTVVGDIEPVVGLSEEIGIPIEVCAFIGSSPIRQYTENWDDEKLVALSTAALKFAIDHELPVMYVTEDTTRSHPDTLRRLFETAIEIGVRRLCLCDTCGHATPEGVTQLIRWTRELIAASKEDVKIDWHGHEDRGLGLVNTLAAIRAGADRVHACALGIGERVGNTAMDTLLVNLKLLGWIDNDLSCLNDYCQEVSRATEVVIPPAYPIFGEDAFLTATGVHASAVIKALRKGDTWLANRVYSGVPADLFGLEQKIAIGHMSGRSNIVYWLEKRDIPVTEELITAIFEHCKASNRLLEDDEVLQLVRRAREA